MTQFLRDQASDSEEVVTPLMLDGTYLSRNFATLGPMIRQPPCDLMCWKVIHGWRLESCQPLVSFLLGLHTNQLLIINSCNLNKSSGTIISPAEKNMKSKNLWCSTVNKILMVHKVNDYQLNYRFPEMWFIDNCQSRKIRSTERFPRAPIKIRIREPKLWSEKCCGDVLPVTHLDVRHSLRYTFLWSMGFQEMPLGDDRVTPQN